MPSKRSFPRYKFSILNLIYRTKTFHLMSNVILFFRKVNFCSFFIRSYQNHILAKPIISFVLCHACVIFLILIITVFKIHYKRLNTSSNKVRKWSCLRIGWIQTINSVIAVELNILWIWHSNNLFRQDFGAVLHFNFFIFHLRNIIRNGSWKCAKLWRNPLKL